MHFIIQLRHCECLKWHSQNHMFWFVCIYVTGQKRTDKTIILTFWIFCVKRSLLMVALEQRKKNKDQERYYILLWPWLSVKVSHESIKQYGFDVISLEQSGRHTCQTPHSSWARWWICSLYCFVWVTSTFKKTQGRTVVQPGPKNNSRLFTSSGEPQAQSMHICQAGWSKIMLHY